MTEPEVSLYIALHHIKNRLTTEDVLVSIDGAHIKTKNQIHFEIKAFMENNGCNKIDSASERWQGTYEVEGFEPKLILTARSGIGDVNIKLNTGEILWIESKKVKENESNKEYSVIREAIGQLVTNSKMPSSAIPIVAVPYLDKTKKLADEWSALPKIKDIGIRFYLVKEDGSFVCI